MIVRRKTEMDEICHIGIDDFQKRILFRLDFHTGVGGGISRAQLKSLGSIEH